MNNRYTNMKQVKRRKTSAFKLIAFAFTVIFSLQMQAQGDPAKGKSLFKTNCTACHKMESKLVGPALKGVTEKREHEWLKKWIKDSGALIKSGDADAKAIFDEYKISMSAYPNFSDADLEDVIAYMANPEKATAKKAAAATIEKVATKDATPDGAAKKDTVEHTTDLNPTKTNMPLWILLALIVAFVLVKRSKAKVLAFPLLVMILLLSAWVTYAYLMQVGVDQGYQPIQPIKYSHKIHAGDNGIDCNYCHSSAKDSKTSGIPSLNVCMNCHVTIDKVAEGTKVGNLGKAELDKEIGKLYKAVGWDKTKREYTGKTSPVKWVRIHKLPDFVYFNHSQHVSVQGVSCQTCHGPIEEMDEVFQAKPLTMKWCVDCHRTTDVKMDNKYYEDIHKQLSKKYNKKSFTEADMGGLECAKCHY